MHELQKLYCEAQDRVCGESHADPPSPYFTSKDTENAVPINVSLANRLISWASVGRSAVWCLTELCRRARPPVYEHCNISTHVGKRDGANVCCSVEGEPCELRATCTACSIACARLPGGQQADAVCTYPSSRRMPCDTGCVPLNGAPWQPRGSRPSRYLTGVCLCALYNRCASGGPDCQKKVDGDKYPTAYHYHCAQLAGCRFICGAPLSQQQSSYVWHTNGDCCRVLLSRQVPNPTSPARCSARGTWSTPPAHRAAAANAGLSAGRSGGTGRTWT